MALCLCETRYGLFRTVKTYKWQEIPGAQGSPWDAVIAKWETWAGQRLDTFAASPFTFDNSRTETVNCTPLQPEFSRPRTDSCRYYNMSSVLEDDVEFGIEPEPKQTEPKNAVTPPDDISDELGPYYAGQDPPGDMWDNNPPAWEPTQIVDGCNCVVASGGDFLSREDDRINTNHLPWGPDPSNATHSEDVEVKFWLSYKRQEKVGYDKSCCNGIGVDAAGTAAYENGWKYLDPGLGDGGKYYEPEWSGEPTIKVAVLYGLFYKSYNELLKMRRRHACL